MAKVWALGNSAAGTTYNTASVPYIEAALAHAGFTDLTVTNSSNTVSVHTGETPTASNTLIALTASGADGFLDAFANSTVHLKRSWGVYIKIVAVQGAVALLSGRTTTASTAGCVLTKDKNGDYVIVQQADGGSWNNYTLKNPAVIARNELYSSLLYYKGETITDFGCTSLAKLPAPSYDGAANYLPLVSFGHAAQYTVNGAMTLNNVKYYSIGGAWYLRDTEE